MENQMSETKKNYLIGQIENGLIEDQLQYSDVDCHMDKIITFVYDEEDDYFYCVDDDAWFGEEYLCFIDDELVAYQDKTVLEGYKPSVNEKKLYNYKHNYIKEMRWSDCRSSDYDDTADFDYEDEIEILGVNGDIDYHLTDYISKDGASLEDVLLEWTDDSNFYEYIKNNLKEHYTTNNI